MSVEFSDTDKTLSQSLTDAARRLPSGSVTLRQLMEQIGEQGLLMFCMFLSLPFLVPVSIPGVSTIFSVVIILVGVGVVLNRLPPLPERIMKREFATESLIPTLESGAKMVSRIDKIIRPRLLMFTQGAAMNRLNGLVLIAAGVLLMVPFGFVPFSNTLPALAILFLAAGMLQRDGFFVVAGYLTTVATVIYFGALTFAAIAAGVGLSSLIGGYILLF